jgi:hypothetical protein
MLKIKTTAETLAHLHRRMATGEPYYFSRFGDADLAIMDGGMGQDQVHDPRLATELREALAFEHPSYDKALALEHPMEPGMRKGLFEPVRRESQQFQRLVSTLTKQTEYENAVVFHYQSVFCPWKMREFLDKHIRPKRKLYIGCYNPVAVEPLIGKVHRWVYTAPKNCYSTMDWWQAGIGVAVSDVDLVVVACGVPTRIVNYMLCKQQVPVQSIDIGSVIDAVAGQTTRTWIRLAGTKDWLKVLTEGDHVASI